MDVNIPSWTSTSLHQFVKNEILPFWISTNFQQQLQDVNIACWIYTSIHQSLQGEICSRQSCTCIHQPLQNANITCHSFTSRNLCLPNLYQPLRDENCSSWSFTSLHQPLYNANPGQRSRGTNAPEVKIRGVLPSQIRWWMVNFYIQMDTAIWMVNFCI